MGYIYVSGLDGDTQMRINQSSDFISHSNRGLMVLVFRNTGNSQVVTSTILLGVVGKFIVVYCITGLLLF
ncbi:hypothetical protein DPMN_123001 [Dreissena polymorpha]|uniref:Uncharacterized protein n=1 Tax=Dreissena polymorpha TaxID=45954 RepID=A0A9D4JSH7_DREPO|nr:hypothetical protein DPMN_123001 [Dreissena polymorpha]